MTLTTVLFKFPCTVPINPPSWFFRSAICTTLLAGGIDRIQIPANLRETNDGVFHKGEACPEGFGDFKALFHGFVEHVSYIQAKAGGDGEDACEGYFSVMDAPIYCVPRGENGRCVGCWVALRYHDGLRLCDGEVLRYEGWF